MGLESEHLRRDCLLGCLGALLLMVGDLCLSVIPVSQSDSGLFAREAYLNGAYPAWRLPLLLVTGLLGMALSFCGVRAVCSQVKPECRIIKRLLQITGVVYLTSTGTLHYIVGSMADWTSILAPLLGREETVSLIAAQYQRLLPAALISTGGMAACILIDAWAVLAEKTVLPRKMFVFHILVWQIVFVIIPDIRQLLGAKLTTLDYMLTQCSGNASMVIWMLSCTIWTGRKEKKHE